MDRVGRETMSRSPALVGWSAVTAVVLYVLATVLGGVLDPGYSHLSMHISELTSSHAPNRMPLSGLYVVYNLSLAVLGFGLWQHLRRSPWSTSAAALLVVTGMGGILLVTWFPQDSYGDPATAAGTAHIILAGIVALTAMLAMVTASRALRPPASATLGRFSLVAAAAMFGSGLVGAIGTALESPYMGALERLPIGVFLLWIMAVGWTGSRGRLDGGPDRAQSREPASGDLTASTR